MRDIGTLRLIAIILGLLGLTILIDVLVITLVDPDRPLDGFRQVLFLIVGALLVVGGVITFRWPDRGTVGTKGDKKQDG